MLLITPTDFAEMPNNVEHARIELYPQMGHRVTIIHLSLNHSRRLTDLVVDSVTYKVKEYKRGITAFFSVDPFFNYCAGLRFHSQTREGDGRAQAGRRVIRWLSPLGALRDVFFVLCIVLTALRRTSATYDVCLGVGPWASIAGLVLRALKRVRGVVYLDRDFEPGLVSGRFRRRYVGWAERYGLRRADVRVSVSHRLRALRARQFGVDTTVIPNGIHWAAYENSRSPRREGRVLIYIGYLADWSGVEEAIVAMRRVRAAFGDAELHIVGHGAPGYVSSLRGKVQSLGLGEAVQFHGARPHHALPKYLSQADIGIASSRPVAYRRYACPLKVMEYMASGIPVIATKSTEASDIVEHLDIGVTIECTPEDFADAVIRLFKNTREYRRLRGNALRQGVNFNWRTLLEQEVELIAARLVES